MLTNVASDKSKTITQLPLQVDFLDMNKMELELKYSHKYIKCMVS